MDSGGCKGNKVDKVPACESIECHAVKPRKPRVKYTNSSDYMPEVCQLPAVVESQCLGVAERRVSSHCPRVDVALRYCRYVR